MNKEQISDIALKARFMLKPEDYKDKIFDIATSLYMLGKSDLISSLKLEAKDKESTNFIELLMQEIENNPSLLDDSKDDNTNCEQDECRYESKQEEPVYDDDKPYSLFGDFMHRTSGFLLKQMKLNSENEARLKNLESQNETLTIAVKFLLGND